MVAVLAVLVQECSQQQQIPAAQAAPALLLLRSSIDESFDFTY
jgi:hypothetical protein